MRPWARPAAVVMAPTNEPVCVQKPWQQRSCWWEGRGHSKSDANMTHASWSTFAFPRGIRYIDPIAQINDELGRDHAKLAVSHTHTKQDPLQVGLWFFYMEGCSDFCWDSGRTVLVRNRCEAAVLLEERAFYVSWSEALGRVARKLVQSDNIADIGQRNVSLKRMGPKIVQVHVQKPTQSHTARTLAERATAVQQHKHGMGCKACCDRPRTVPPAKLLATERTPSPDHRATLTCSDTAPAQRA